MYFNKNPKPNKKFDRRHYNYRGKVKIQYNSKEDAKVILQKYPDNYRAYLCPICNKWHIGFIK